MVADRLLELLWPAVVFNSWCVSALLLFGSLFAGGGMFRLALAARCFDSTPPEQNIVKTVL